MERDITTLDHFRMISQRSRKYTDSSILELTNAVMTVLEDLQDQIPEGEYDMINTRTNILDNCDFKINQRGVSGTISTPGYFVDRWKLTEGRVSIEKDGIKLDGTIEQILENKVEGTVTASVFFDNGIMAASYDDTDQIFKITANGQLLKMAKLELGNKQTLACQDGGKWVLNDPPPNPQQELAKCQRYYWRPLKFSGKLFQFPHAMAYNATTLISFLYPPVPFHAAPTIKYSLGSGGRFEAWNSARNSWLNEAHPITNVSIGQFYGGQFTVSLTTTDLVRGDMYQVQMDCDYIEFNADL